MADEDEIIVRRELQASGKTRATVNGALVPANVLRDLGPDLAVIHGQHEPQGLLDPDTHLDVVDRLPGTTSSHAADPLASVQQLKVTVRLAP